MNDPKKFQVRLLGPPVVARRDGNAIKLSTQKSLALLSMVASSGNNALARELAALRLWSRSPETQARTNLRQALSVIRTAIGDEVIRSDGGKLSLNRDLVKVDIDCLGDDSAGRVESISEFGGPFLDGMSINEPIFEEWLLAKRAQYARSVRDILFDIGNAALEAGNAARALQAADRMLALDPFEEAGMALCLKAHAAKGERARLQIRFDDFERVLRLELGIGIGSDLIALKTRLLNAHDTRAVGMTPISVPTVLVLPLKTLSDLAEHRYFSDGLAEDVITQLSRFSTLRVVSHQTNPDTKHDESLLAQARNAGADYLVTGSVRWLGARFRLSTELIEVESGAVIWAERLDRETADLFELQDEVSRHLAGAIPYKVEAEVAEKAKKKSDADLQAYDLMILGKRLRDTISLEGNLEARSLLERAVQKDQGLARSHMYLSDSYVVQHWLGALDEAGKEKALYHARRAVALDPNDVHIQDHLGFALHVMGHWDAALSQIMNALSVAENEIESLSWCGYALLMLGKHREAAEIIDTVARRRTTLPPTFEWILGQLYSFQGRDAEVIRTLNGASLLNSIGLAFRAGAQARLGMCEEAAFTLSEFKASRLREQRLSGMTEGAETVGTALAGFRPLWRRSQDWEHIANGLRLAGLTD